MNDERHDEDHCVGNTVYDEFEFIRNAAPVTDNTPKEAYDDITRSLSDLHPITFQAPAEKYKLLVFIDNQCGYCSDVVKMLSSTQMQA